MAITSYAELKVAVARWTGGSDASDATALGFSSTIDDLIMIGETRLLREVATMETEASISTAITSGVISVPSDYMNLKFLYIDGTPVQTLERRTAEWLYGNYSNRSASGKPKVVAREGSSFIFGPYPDSGYTVKGVYYKQLPAIATTINALFTANPDLYLSASLAESNILIGNKANVGVWEAKYKMIRDAVNGAAKQEDSSGSTLRMRLG